MRGPLGWRAHPSFGPVREVSWTSEKLRHDHISSLAPLRATKTESQSQGQVGRLRSCKVLVRLEELAPDAPAQGLPDTITVEGGDARVPPSLAFGIRECKENPRQAAAVVVVRNRKGRTHLSPWFVLIWRPVHAFGGWVRCRIRKGLEPSLL
jgi:hypothetical protein